MRIRKAASFERLFFEERISIRRALEVLWLTHRLPPI
jgi:hypothetical protein